MKKILVIALAVVMLVSVFTLTACAEEQTVSGEYKYENPHAPGKFYGVKVDVTIIADVITNVVITSTNTEEYTNLTASWGDKATWENGVAAFLDSFKGRTVAELNAIQVACNDKGEPEAEGIAGFAGVAGATQSSGRVILAVQNALSQLTAN